MYAEWIVPFERQVAQAVRDEGAFVYTHTCGAIGDRLDLLAETGIHGIETLDPPPLGTVDLAMAKTQLRDRLFIKGNVDPVNTLLRKSRGEALADIRWAHEIGRVGGQFILSTACSVAPHTPPENVRLLADVVHGRA
jgi:uroporphyrinogen-III decarboxylase